MTASSCLCFDVSGTSIKIYFTKATFPLPSDLSVKNQPSYDEYPVHWLYTRTLRWEAKAVRTRTCHPLSYAETKKMKSLTLRHGRLKGLLLFFFFLSGRGASCIFGIYILQALVQILNALL